MKSFDFSWKLFIKLFFANLNVQLLSHSYFWGLQQNGKNVGTLIWDFWFLFMIFKCLKVVQEFGLFTNGEC
jgi:hypothetical protein